MNITERLVDEIIPYAHRLEDRFSDPYTYTHPLRQQLTNISDGLIKNEYITETGAILKRPNVNAQFVYAQVANCASAFKMMGALEHNKGLAVNRLLQIGLDTIRTGDFLVSLICFRSVIEHVAHFHTAVRNAEVIKIPETSADCVNILFDYHGVLFSAAYGTRTDWTSALTAEKARWQQKAFTYSPSPSRLDLQSKSIMNHIDKLSKSVPGSRTIYEILCEFAHPNGGTFFSFLTSADSYIGQGGLKWVRQEFASSDPTAFLNESQPLFQNLFDIFKEVLQQFEEDLEKWSAQKKKIAKLTQRIVRDMLERHSSLFDPYGPCPCGSSRKLKFCCKRHLP